MTNKPLFYPLIVIFSLFVLVACSKEGDTGPVGPAGPAGPAGPVGPAGPAGSANVIYSDWLDVDFEPNEDSSNWTATIPAASLTQEMLNQGEIKVYINFNTSNDPVVFPLPYFDGAVIINPVFFTDTIALVSTVDASTIQEAGDTFFQYRYVLIPGSELAAIPANINLDRYADVKKYFKLTN
jgi:hypothetical protein